MRGAGASRLLVGLVVYALVVAGVGIAVSHVSHDIGRARSTAGVSVSADPSASSSPTAQAQPPHLVVEPQMGMSVVYSLLASAKTSIDITMYELSDQIAEGELAASASRHVRVRVLLDSSYHGGEVNKPAYLYLTAHGVEVHWAPSTVIFHQKTITVDGKISAIGTGNLTANYYATSRDYWFFDSNPSDVAAIETVFTSDWEGNPVAPGPAGADLVWSPGAAGPLVSLITSAKRSVIFESEELSDETIISALVTDAKRGVRCEVVMEDEAKWARAFDELRAAGCSVRTYPESGSLYIHAKVIVVDAGTPTAEIYLGSQNASVASLTYNRELGVVLSTADDGSVVSVVASVAASDFSGGTRWTS